MTKIHLQKCNPKAQGNINQLSSNSKSVLILLFNALWRHDSHFSSAELMELHQNTAGVKIGSDPKNELSLELCCKEPSGQF